MRHTLVNNPIDDNEAHMDFDLIVVLECGELQLDIRHCQKALFKTRLLTKSNKILTIIAIVAKF